MEERFRAYFEEIGLLEPMMEKVKVGFKQIEMLIQEPVADVFVNEFPDQENVRIYEMVIYFTANYEVELFLNKNIYQIECICYKNNIYSYVVFNTDYDFEKSTEKSRIVFSAKTNNGQYTINLKASGKNCEHAQALAAKYIIPNMKPEPKRVRPIERKKPLG